MALQNFIDYQGPTITAAFLNGVDILKFTVFGDATTKAAARANLVSDAVWSISQGGTGAITAAAARVSLTADAPLEVNNGGTGQRVLTGLQNALQVGGAQTASELAAGVTPTNYAYSAGPVIDPRRYNTSIGNPVNDLASVNSAISVMKQLDGGQVIIPPEYSTAMTVPALGLSPSQAGSIRDLRLGITGRIGAIVETIEGRDGSGGYASEWQIRGKQNPGVVLQTLSDGTAPGYSIANYGGSFVSRRPSGANNFQLLVDPYLLGYGGDYSLIGYCGAGSTFSESVYVGADANNKHRWNFQTNRLAQVAINISSVTNTTPIVVNLASNHNIQNSLYTGVAIAGTGAGVNGSWKAQVTGPAQLTLLNSVAAGAYGAVGTATTFPRLMRAVLNVPTVQGGTESIVSEGSHIIASTTDGVGYNFNDLTNTLIGGWTYNTSSSAISGQGIKGISQSAIAARNIAGTTTFVAATSVAVTFPVAESNANYRVVVTATSNPGGYMWVTGKLAAGFTINCSVVNSATVDWIIIRD